MLLPCFCFGGFIYISEHALMRSTTGALPLRSSAGRLASQNAPVGHLKHIAPAQESCSGLQEAGGACVRVFGICYMQMRSFYTFWPDSTTTIESDQAIKT